MKIIKLILILILLLLTVSGSVISCSAEDAGEDGTEQALPSLPEEFAELLDNLPDDVARFLPEDLFSSDAGKVGDAVRGMSGFSYLLNTALSLIGLRLPECAGILARVCGLLLLSAVFRALQSSLGGGQVGKALSFCAILAVTLCLLSEGTRSILTLTGYFERLRALCAGILPVMAALYAMGGNFSSAVAASSGLSLYLTLTEEVVGKSILPFCGICLSLAFSAALDPAVRPGTLLAAIKKNYTTVLAFLMTLLIAMLGAQSVLGARSDSLAMRSARFAAGNLIPVVGGSVSELLRTVSAGVSYLRGVVGICGIILLLLSLLPSLTELFLMRLTWQICASVAELLGCENEKKLLDEFASLSGYLIAAAAVCSSVLLLALTLLTHCAAAVGS